LLKENQRNKQLRKDDKNIIINIDQSKRTKTIRHSVGGNQKAAAPSVITSFIPAPAAIPFNNMPSSRNQFQETIRSSQVAAPQPVEQPTGIMSGIRNGISRGFESGLESAINRRLNPVQPIQRTS
jgi:hypothetical protein